MPEFRLAKTFRFEAAHHLPAVPETHRCHRLHGHSYEVEVVITGAIHEDTGWVVDFADISAAFAPVSAALDHRLLNEVAGLENPTSENLARWICLSVSQVVQGVHSVRVSETPTSSCTYFVDG